MANFQLASKRLIINSPEQHPIDFFNLKANGAWEKVTDPATFATATIMRIAGYGDFFAENSGKGTIKARGAKGIASVPEIATLTITADFITAIGVGNEFNLELQFKSTALEVENANWDARFGRTRTLPFIIDAGETPTTLAAKIIETIEYDQNLVEVYLASATAALGVVTFTTKRGGLNIKAKVFETATGLTFAVTQPGYAGRGSYEYLKTVRIETPANIYPHSMDDHEIPVKGQLYSNYELHQVVERPDLSNGSVANGGPIQGKYGWELFINQTSASAVIALITPWINANVPHRTMYGATSAADSLTETPTVATAKAITPFATPIV